MAEAQNQDAAAEGEAMAREEAGAEEPPVVDSPSISGGWLDGEDAAKPD